MPAEATAVEAAAVAVEAAALAVEAAGARNKRTRPINTVNGGVPGLDFPEAFRARKKACTRRRQEPAAQTTTSPTTPANAVEEPAVEDPMSKLRKDVCSDLGVLIARLASPDTIDAPTTTAHGIADRAKILATLGQAHMLLRFHTGGPILSKTESP
ncbi:hypothetical protein JDV02_010570 [Purpureocillium takamizusanense]|uniref:Uncharacterized protein n=1 Tax=Purpureocillium takamizusanense TaxID=2060973 RepID=A0A9Q8QSY9_9HYPO|nr:uncharacterized protein JDV02_010570 [Purpureocillium takamizusanense]UNI24852.1 hypothetical protein JDV02_010570 [Purpureocillium takamizusanense]